MRNRTLLGSTPKHYPPSHDKAFMLAKCEVYDPSELRSDVNGKVVRYLHDEGSEVAKGESYIELEAMKMIMSLKACCESLGC